MISKRLYSQNKWHKPQKPQEVIKKELKYSERNWSINYIFYRFYPHWRSLPRARIKITQRRSARVLQHLRFEAVHRRHRIIWIVTHLLNNYGTFWHRIEHYFAIKHTLFYPARGTHANEILQTVNFKTNVWPVWFSTFPTSC